MHRNRYPIVNFFLLLLAMLLPVIQAANAEPGKSSLPADISALKEDVVRLHQDLLELENELLFPANTRVNIFLSLEKLNSFTLESIELLEGEKLVTTHIYSQEERTALNKGGIQPLYQGNLSPGKHQIVARLTGRDSSGNSYRQLKPVSVEKTSRSLFIELRLSGAKNVNKPELQIKTWD